MTSYGFCSFFVSALLRSKPYLIHKPVAVAHGMSDGCEISSCNYPARAKGVRNGMFMRSAKEKCPDLIALKYDFELYEKLSEQIYNIFYSIPEAVIVQPVSVDEAYLEFPSNVDANLIASNLRQQVFSETQCPCSAGIGPNMLLAKLATKKAKPNGQYEIHNGNLYSAIGDLKLDDLPGIGWKISKILGDHGLYKVNDVIPFTKEELQVVRYRGGCLFT